MSDAEIFASEHVPIAVAAMALYEQLEKTGFRQARHTRIVIDALLANLGPEAGPALLEQINDGVRKSLS